MTLIPTRRKSFDDPPENPARARRQSTLVWIVFLACCGMLLGVALADTPAVDAPVAGAPAAVKRPEHGWELSRDFLTPAVPVRHFD